MNKLKHWIKLLLIRLHLMKPIEGTEQEVEKIEKKGDFIYYKYKCVPFKVRHTASSDLSVLNQILIHKEYASVLSYFQTNAIPLQVVIDAGANIGLTSIYLKAAYPQVKIACVEPDTANFEMLKSNLSSFESDTIHLFKAGLMGKDGLSLSVGTDFRGGLDWAKQTIVSSEDSALKSITVPEIMKQLKAETIDLLKIDIEGAETFLLEAETDLRFLANTKCLAIEIHDEYNCRSQIYEVLKSHGFLLLEDVETTIALNKHFI